MTHAEFNEGLKTVAVSAFAFVCVCLGIFLLHANRTLTEADVTLANVNTQVVEAGKTQHEVAKLVVRVKDLVTHTDQITFKEKNLLDNMNGKLLTSVDNINGTLADLRINQNELTAHSVASIDAATAEIKAFGSVTDELKTNAISLNKTVLDTDKLVTNPAIAKTLSNTQDLTKSSAETMQHMSATTADVQHLVHSYVYPTWLQKVTKAVTGTGISIAKFFF